MAGGAVENDAYEGGLGQHWELSFNLLLHG